MTLSGRATVRLRRALRELGGDHYSSGRGRRNVVTSVVHDLAHWQDFGWPLHEAPGGRDMGSRVGDCLWAMRPADRLQAEFRACAIHLLADHHLTGDPPTVPAHWGVTLHNAFGLITPAEASKGIADAQDLTSSRLSAEALATHLRRMAAPTRAK